MNDKTTNIEKIIKIIVNSYKDDKTEILCTKTENNVTENKIQKIINQIVNTYKNNDSNLLFSNTDEPKEIHFQSIIENIKKSFTTDFEKYELSKIEILHQKIENGIATPVLYVCGKGTQEIRYTKYLAYFLDYKNNHGLDKLLFETLFNQYLIDFSIDIKQDTDYKIIDEFYLPLNIDGKEIVNNSIDIAILSNDFNIFIEQKIHSGESINPKTELSQLVRYGNAIENAFPKQNNIKIFLTPTGQIPENTNNWIGLSHIELVEKAMQLLNSNLSNIAKSNLRSFLMDLSIGPYFDFDIISKIKDLTKKIIIDKSIIRFTELKSIINKNEILISLLN